MASRFRAFAQAFLITLNILLAVFYLLACLAPYLNPSHWWFISLLGLAFSFLFFLLLFSILFWLVIRIKYALLFFIVLLLGWKSILVSFAFNLTRNFNYERQAGTLRIVTWNVARFIEIMKNSNK
jgi:hypothetical protein